MLVSCEYCNDDPSYVEYGLNDPLISKCFHGANGLFKGCILYCVVFLYYNFYLLGIMNGCVFDIF
jgi:hypothetical protein